MEAAQCTNYHEAWWAAVPNGQQVMPGPFEARRFDIRQTPAVWLDALTLQMQQTPSPCARMSRPARSGAALPGKRASRGHGSGKDLEVSGLNAWPFVRSKASEPWAPAPPPPPRLPGASVSRGEAERTPTHGLRGAPGPPLALPRRVRTPGTPRRAAPRPHLVDVAVGAAADALNQLEVLLRVPAGQIEAGVHGGPRVHPASLPGRGGGRSGGHTESGSRGRPPAPPAVTIARLHAAAAAAALLTPPPPPPPRTTTTGLTVPAPRSPLPSRKPRSHPRGEENARSPSLGVKLQHGFRLRRSSPSPHSRSSNLLPSFPGSGPTAQPRSRTERSPASRAPGASALRPCAAVRRQLVAGTYPT